MSRCGEAGQMQVLQSMPADSNINGTTALKRHFNICKCNPHINCKDKEAMLTATKGEGISTWRYDPKAIRRTFTEMVIEDEMPFVMVRSQDSRSTWL